MTSGAERHVRVGDPPAGGCTKSMVCSMVALEDGLGAADPPRLADPTSQAARMSCCAGVRAYDRQRQTYQCVTDLARPRIREAPAFAGASFHSTLAARNVSGQPPSAAEPAQLALPVLRSRAWKTHFRPRDERRGEACQEICKGSRLLSSQMDKPAGKLSWIVPSARK